MTVIVQKFTARKSDDHGMIAWSHAKWLEAKTNNVPLIGQWGGKAGGGMGVRRGRLLIGGGGAGGKVKMTRTLIFAHDITFVRDICRYRLPIGNLRDVLVASWDVSRYHPPHGYRRT